MPWAFAWLLAVLAAFSPARATDRQSPAARYVRDQWGARRGFSGGTIYTIAETTDGFLWIGTEKGLVRFDGLTFRLFDHSNSPDFSGGPVLGLAADADGSLWIRLESPRLLRYRAGVFEQIWPEVVRQEDGVTAMGRGRDGAVLLARSNGALRFSRGQVVNLPLTGLQPNLLVISMAETADATVWLGTRDAGLFSLHDGRIASLTEGLPDKKVNALLAVGDRDLWIGTDHGVVRWDGTKVTRSGVPASLARGQALAMVKDRESNIWVAMADGLFRISTRGATLMDRRERTPDQAVTTLLVDRQGDVWAGSRQGLERFRNTVFTTFSGQRFEDGGPIYADANGRTWFAPSSGGLLWLKGAQTGQVTSAGLAKQVIYSITGGPEELWMGTQRQGLVRLSLQAGSFTIRRYTQANGLAQDNVYAVHRSRDGTVWAGTVRRGVSKLNSGRFTTYTVADGLASNTVEAIAETADGTMWFATPNGLSALANDTWRVYTGKDGLPLGSLNCLFADSAGALWIGTSKGLVSIRSGRVEPVRNAPEPLQEGILGIAEDQGGWLWIVTVSHVLQVSRDGLLRGATGREQLRIYGGSDGLPGTEGVKRQRSVITDSLGRVWLSLRQGLAVVDPVDLAGGASPPLVHIETVSADGNPLDLRAPLHIPSGRRRITFGFVGIDLSAPEDVRYRYFLDPYDRDWSEPIATREAAYTNLSPGPYRLRVMAGNSSGVWNNAETTIAFTIEPALWQTWWFRLAAGLVCLFITLTAYRLRLRRLTRELDLRFEERLAERTLVAQGLHDTLLQGFLSASMQLHVAADLVPGDSPAKPRLERVIQLIGQVIEEGRNAVRGLRSSHARSLDLENAFSRIPQELGIQDGPGFRVIVEGHPRPLTAVLRDDVYRIGREAVVNAFRHSGAKSVEVEVEYAAKSFRLLVRDNGRGIDPTVVQAGREGHWGLPGLRERAERIGARLRLWSSSGAGTEVELTIPNHVAFASSSSSGLGRWLRIPHRPPGGSASAPPTRRSNERKKD